MCQLAWTENIRSIASTAHQNDHYPDNTPEAIKASTAQLAAILTDLHIPLQLVPVGEVMVSEHTWEAWLAGELLSYGDHGKHILLEMPHNLFLDIRPLIDRFVEAGVTPVLAHAERYPELLFGARLVDDFIRHGCLIQVTSGMISDPPDRRFRNALKDWAQRGVIHVLGSDAHSPRRRRPVMQAAATQLTRWIGELAAMAIVHQHPQAILTGQNVSITAPRSPRKKFLGVF
jgi:protein-tyrosine phosphatase